MSPWWQDTPLQLGRLQWLITGDTITSLLRKGEGEGGEGGLEPRLFKNRISSIFPFHKSPARAAMDSVLSLKLDYSHCNQIISTWQYLCSTITTTICMYTTMVTNICVQQWCWQYLQTTIVTIFVLNNSVNICGCKHSSD